MHEQNQGLHGLLDYLAQVASSGTVTELPITPEKLGQYYGLETGEVVNILSTLVSAGALSIQPNDKLAYTVPAYADIPTVEDYSTMQRPDLNETLQLPPNPIQVIPLLTTLRDPGFFLGEPTTDPSQFEKDHEKVSNFTAPRHDDWLQDSDRQ